MKKLNNKELCEINGGAMSLTTYIGIGLVVSFALGILDGIINPQKCN
ncbi:MAG: hypothetical protein R3Y13_02490 [bacterium]